MTFLDRMLYNYRINCMTSLQLVHHSPLCHLYPCTFRQVSLATGLHVCELVQPSFLFLLFAHPTQSWQRAVVSESGSAECFVLSKERKKFNIKSSWLRVFQMMIQACIAPRLDHQLKVLLLQSSLLFQQSPVWDSFSVMFSYEEVCETPFLSHISNLYYIHHRRPTWAAHQQRSSMQHTQ